MTQKGKLGIDAERSLQDYMTYWKAKGYEELERRIGKKGRSAKSKQLCPTCKGSFYYRAPYQCWKCEELFCFGCWSRHPHVAPD